MKAHGSDARHVKKAKPKETAMFIFACTVLAFLLITFLMPHVLDLVGYENGVDPDVEKMSPSETILAAIEYVWLAVIVILPSLVAFMVIGAVFSVKLLLRRNLIPRWMYISAWALAALYAVAICITAFPLIKFWLIFS